MTSFELGDLAEKVAGRVIGGGEIVLEAIRALGSAGEKDLSFLHSPAYLDEALASKAGAFLLPERHVELAESLGRPALVATDSHLALAQLIAIFNPPRRPAAGVHSTAVVAEGCEIAESAHLGPYVVVGEGSRVGEHAVLEAHAVVGRDCVVGDDAWLHPGVVLYDGTLLGERVEVHSGAVLGADGFGYATSGGVHHKVPQVGHVVIEDDVEIGANSTIDRALLEQTRIGAGSKIDNLVQVGHNVQTGRSCLLCGQAGIAGSTELGDYVVLAGQAGIIDHLKLGDQVQVAAASAVFEDIPAGRKVGGIPAIDLARYKRQVVAISKLSKFARRFRRLERRLEEQSDD